MVKSVSSPSRNPAAVGGGPVGTGFSGHRGLQPWTVREAYKAYQSPYGPKYKQQFNFHGITKQHAIRFGTMAGSFGAVAGIFALFFFAEVPKVRDDIMIKVPIIGEYFEKKIAPEDNPF
ncbi:hypothetical protein GQ43DRAFT_398716 [Delitschia confertaspora ATCC 74209]|uniref:Uncharacterized protein n=1 Tax=Delitschia confertaspora ATCC 74209 TaxID=1513339 RepID=A0A9P4MNF9_9PLEO|nr:hypothetical protein GQ43DRAFT_398716 [Delitschia confertaspora ATCC 74209]